MTKNNVEEKLDLFEKRIEKLEKAVFDQKAKPKSLSNDYKGLVGGINFLINSGFFKKLVSVNEVHKELKKESYVYPIKSVEKILRVDFFHKKKILIRDKEDGVWKYALRK